jgi:hypothetical protein
MRIAECDVGRVAGDQAKRSPAMARTSRLRRNSILPRRNVRALARATSSAAVLASLATTLARGRSKASAKRDGTAAGARVGHAQVAIERQAAKRQLHQQLGLRPGISVAGSTARSNRQNPRWPVRYATGSPAPLRRTSASKRSAARSSGLGVADARTASCATVQHVREQELRLDRIPAGTAPVQQLAIRARRAIMQ